MLANLPGRGSIIYTTGGAVHCREMVWAPEVPLYISKTWTVVGHLLPQVTRLGVLLSLLAPGQLGRLEQCK